MKYEIMFIVRPNLDEETCKEKGKVRSEGKDYLMQDGDICLFRFNR